ncbi:MAG: oligoendopeptidase F [Cellulosilyticaceae bacterium]
MSSHTLKKRSDVQSENTWRLEDMFAADTEVTSSIAASYKALEDFSKYQGKLTSDGATLYEALQVSDAFAMVIEKIYLYTHMRLHQDGGNSFYQGFASQSEKLLIDAGARTAFVNPELSELSPERFEAFVTQVPELSVYRRQFEELQRQKAHILDPSTESLLAKFQEVGNAPKNIYAMFHDADITFPTITDSNGNPLTLTHGNFITCLESEDRRVRQEAFEAFYSVYLSFKNTLSSILGANVAQSNLFAKVRNFPSTLEKSLDKNNIPTAVYTNLIETIIDNVNLMHDYLAVRKDQLGVDTLHMYDLAVPLVKDFNKHITFDEACDIILKALAPMGEDYIAILKEAFNNRWIDKYENQGKRSGAYSWGCHGLAHPYVLMNYMNNLDNLFTLAHEMGHAVHSYLSHGTQPYAYGSYCIFVAEVASTVNEALLMQYLLKTTTDPLYRKYLINHFMEQFRTTVYRQTMFAEFEKIIFDKASAGESLTTDVICDTYYSLVKKYHGDDMVVDEAIAIEWSRIPHFYNTPFYVYQYATGFSAAIALSTGILEKGEEAVTKYKSFLSGGSSKDPIDLLKDAGVDMSTKAPIEEALHVFKKLIEEFKTL